MRAGQKIEVIDTNLKSLKGTSVTVSEEAMQLRTGKGEISVERAKVLRVSDRERTRRGRNALIGAAVGAGAGIGVLALLATRGFDSPGAVQAPATIVLTSAGAGLGAAVPSYPTIYRAKKRP